MAPNIFYKVYKNGFYITIVCGETLLFRKIAWLTHPVYAALNLPLFACGVKREEKMN
jgi:hypothetical protein